MALVGDRERDRAVEQLRSHYLRGRLTEDELDARLSVALAARSGRDVRGAFRELPPAWRDGADELRAAFADARIVARRLGFFLAAAVLWCVATLAVVLGLAVAAAIADVSQEAVAAVLLVWLLVTYSAWRIARRGFRGR
jgi:Domain of unknown function (DUF1707)